MNIDIYIAGLVDHAISNGLAEEVDRIFLINRVLAILEKDDYEAPTEKADLELEALLQGLLDYAVERGICGDDITSKDLFDTKIMGALTPLPREVIKTFWEKYEADPVAATDWYYKFSGDTDYIRRYRIKKDMRWKYINDFGELDITINLSKPEKDPKAIAAAKNAPQSAYPKCQLCAENEGYAGRLNHPARANHRIIPIQIYNQDWFLQYSPYVYYNEHCIVLNAAHVPMVIDRPAFEKLLDFVTLFPHYFVGSNADLPIVGGSILSHEHFQGGHYQFAMESAPIEKEVTFKGYEDISAGIVKWPMSVIRIKGSDPKRLAALADEILTFWRAYSDESVGILAFSDDEPHNTITPIARRRGQDYEMDLVLRCNIRTEDHPMGLFHPHADKHNIKKENIGLIEVMGLAVLPSRLKKELNLLADRLVNGGPIAEDPDLEKHAVWAKGLQEKHSFTAENAMDILMEETGAVFSAVLEDAGVYKCTDEGRAAFDRFIQAVNQAKEG